MENKTCAVLAIDLTSRPELIFRNDALEALSRIGEQEPDTDGEAGIRIHRETVEKCAVAIVGVPPASLKKDACKKGQKKTEKSREEVVRALRLCKNAIASQGPGENAWCGECPYKAHLACFMVMLRDAADMLSGSME